MKPFVVLDIGSARKHTDRSLPKKLIYQLFPTYLVITVVAVFVLAWLAIHTIDDFYYQEKTKELRSRALLVSEVVSESLLTNMDELTELCIKLGQLTDTRITLIAQNGNVLGDSEESPATMDNHGTRPEVHAALREGIGTAKRYSFTLGQDMLYLAIPVTIGSTPIIVRSSFPITFLQLTIDEIRRKVLFGGVIIILIVSAISLVVSRRIAFPLKQMQEGAERFASGDFSNRLTIYETEEIGGLADSLNRMASQLDGRIKTILNERNERDAVLSSMVEGVLAVDTQECILSLNNAAAELFQITETKVIGKAVHEVIRNTGFIQFIRQVLSDNAYVEKELIFSDSTEKYLKTQGTVLKNSEGKRIGALIVFDDITQLKRLENMRRDFVANVSHELKTPITSIKGSADTLMEADLLNSPDAKKFLEIVVRQSDRLNAIVNDLLELSQIEQQEENEDIALDATPLKPVIDLAIQDSHMQAEQKNIRLSVMADECISARINTSLIQQAVVNLIDNALKYSEEGTDITVSLNTKDGEVLLSVRDQGCGIDDVHLPRLFERFYRVDKGRSRKQGGTGLGLSIVKHIAHVHQGTVSVESRLGEGSTFTIHLPQN